MAATVSLSESNGAGETITASITNTNMGSTDAVNLVSASYPITANTRSYAKYQRLYCSNLNGSTSIANLKVWRTGALGGSDTHVTNARLTVYGGAATYATPVNTAISGVDQTMPTASPASANLGIGGLLTGALTGVGYSDYLVHQLIIDSLSTSGTSTTLSVSYDEIA